MIIESMVLLAKKPASTPTPVPVTETAENYIARMPQILSRILLALAVLLIGWIVLRIGKWIIFKTIRRKNRKNAGSSQRADTMRSVTSSIYTYLLFFVIVEN